MSGSIMAYPGPKSLKETYLAKVELVNRIKELERVAGAVFNGGMRNSAVLRSLPEADEQRFLDLNMDFDKLSHTVLEARIDQFEKNHNPIVTKHGLHALEGAAQPAVALLRLGSHPGHRRLGTEGPRRAVG